MGASLKNVKLSLVLQEEECCLQENPLKHSDQWTWWGFSRLWAFPRPLIPGVCDSSNSRSIGGKLGLLSDRSVGERRRWGCMSVSGVRQDFGRAVIDQNVFSRDRYLCCTVCTWMFALHSLVEQMSLPDHGKGRIYREPCWFSWRGAEATSWLWWQLSPSLHTSPFQLFPALFGLILQLQRSPAQWN